tara:strand:+ start:1634 stop:1879 length:246 start_codon:yes stop_codon:yes gene_type:complete
MVDETGVTTLLLELAESNGTWKAVAVGGLVLVWRWWQTVQKHLCEAIPDALAIARNITEDGLDIRLKVHMCEDKEEGKDDG